MAVINPRLIISAVTEVSWNARLDAWLTAGVFIGLSLFLRPEGLRPSMAFCPLNGHQQQLCQQIFQ